MIGIVGYKIHYCLYINYEGSGKDEKEEENQNS